MYRIYKIFTTFSIILLGSLQVWAQPTLVLSDATVPAESITSIDFSVMDFTDITKTKFSLNWDVNELEFIGITNINTGISLNLSEANFEVSNAASGNLVFDWEDPNGVGMTLDDGMKFFSLEFRALIPEGETASVTFADTPEPIVINRNASGDTNIFDPDMVPPVNGDITATAPIPDIFFSFSPQEQKSIFCKGDQICYDIKVAAFEDAGMTAYITWDSSVLNYVKNGNVELHESTELNVVEVDAANSIYENIARINILKDFGTLSIPDSTVIFSLCFEIVGEPASSTTFSILDNTEFDTDAFTAAGEIRDLVLVNIPTIEVTDCQSLINFSVACEDVKAEETICIDFTASNFTDVQSAKYSVTYDPAVLEFVEAKDFNLPNLSSDNIAVNNGVLNFNWSNAGSASLDNGEALFSACFKAIGEIDAISAINFINLAGNALGHEVKNTSGETLTPEFNNCEIQILPPTVGVALPTMSAPPGEEICLPITVTNFLNVSHIEMPLEWDPAVLEFVDIKTTGLTGLTINDFDTGDIDEGKLQLITWDSPNEDGLTLADDASIFEVCFKVIGNLGDASAIAFPTVANNPVFILNNNDQDPGTANTNGLVTVGTASLALLSEMQEVKKEGSFCVAIAASNFQNILSLDYAHVYDSSVLRFDSVQVSGAISLTPADIVETTEGKIKVVWFSELPDGGISVPDETVLYSLCFTAIGDLGACANFSLDEIQDIQTTESGGEDIGLFNNLGEICVDNFGLTVLESIRPTCRGGDGAINLNVSGDEGERFLFFVTRNEEPFLSNEDVVGDQIKLDNLVEGNYCVVLNSITDVTKSTTECFDLTLSEADLPKVNLGEDKDAGCLEEGTVLDVTLDASSFTLPQGTSGGFTRKWTTMGTAAIPEGTETEDVTTALAPGNYIFTVTINSTSCAASDTIRVFTTQSPRVQVAERGGTLGCTNSTFELGIEVLDENEHNIYYWTTDVGNFVTDSTSLNPIIDAEGIYKFVVLDTVNGCSGSDSTFITLDVTKPNANAGLDLEMGCEDEFIQLQGIGSNGATVEWSTPDGSSIFYPDVDNQSVANVTRVGTYIFTAINEINGCQKSDTMVINADNSLPVARIEDVAFIGCGASAVTLDGSNSSQGPSFAYQWENPNGELISDEDTLRTDIPGSYLLVVTNIDNDDCISDSVRIEVKEDKTKPSVSIAQTLTLSCQSDCSPLTAVVPEGDHYQYEWTSGEGIICEGENTPTVMVKSIGVYRILVMDTNNNCTSTAASIVGGDGTEIVADAGPARQIDCKTEIVTLDGRGSTNTATVVYSWKNEAGVEVSSEVMAEVSEAGEYVLEVMDSQTGCNASGKVLVTMDLESPTAEAGESPAISGCEFPQGQRLNGNESTRGDNITYAWFSNSGNLVGDTAIAAPEIKGPGIFTLTVTNTSNGCFSTDQVTVQSDVVIPIPNAGVDKMISCDEPMLTLAGLSEVLPAGSTIEWTTSDGNIVGDANQLAVNIDAVGTYVLSIMSPDGCTATDEVTVTGNLDLPEANAGETVAISCNEPVTLNGSGSVGENIEITWTGGNVIAGANTYTPQVNRGGSYMLVVTNVTNNCKNTSLVIVTDENNLPIANAGENQETCLNEASLNATLPTGDYTGTWSTLENGLIINANDPTTSVADLDNGQNTFIWTLSSEECGVFSADTVAVNVPSLPVARDDVFEFQPGQGLNTLDVVQNDQSNSIDYNVSILVPPTVGELFEVNKGVFEFTTPARYFGSQEFQYEICSATCSDLCDIANVRVVVLPGEGVDTTNTIPNAITPNGDGLNDMLLVDELIFDALDFPRSQMIIFNRWGDVVYRASPYNNDWQGQATNGDPLPEGTYYYVLRLDIVEGEVMKGDVTILR